MAQNADARTERFLLPDLALASEAKTRRRDFRRCVGIFLDLVAMNLAGGRGLPEALMSASTVGDHWALVRLRQALANARLYGTTPWAALGDLGRELDVEELEELSGALVLAAEDGAKHDATHDAADAATLAKGRDIFTNYGCGGCHSLAAAGAEGHVGPVLDNPTLTKDVIVDRVVNGSGPMPAFGDQLSKEDLSALAAFILQSQHK